MDDEKELDPDNNRSTDKELIQELLSHVIKRSEFSQHTLQRFINLSKQAIKNSTTSTIPNEFNLLSNQVSLYWQTKKYLNDENSAFVFQMGQLYMCITMLDEINKTTLQREEFDRLSKHKDKYLPFLQNIEQTPGIRHKELAERMRWSVSSLSQFVSKQRLAEYYSTTVAGREKFYYLTQAGKKLLKELQKEDEKLKNTTVYWSDYLSEKNCNDNDLATYADWRQKYWNIVSRSPYYVDQDRYMKTFINTLKVSYEGNHNILIAYYDNSFQVKANITNADKISKYCGFLEYLNRLYHDYSVVLQEVFVKLHDELLLYIDYDDEYADFRRFLMSDSNTINSLVVSTMKIGDKAYV